MSASYPQCLFVTWSQEILPGGSSVLAHVHHPNLRLSVSTRFHIGHHRGLSHERQMNVILYDNIFLQNHINYTDMLILFTYWKISMYNEENGKNYYNTAI